MQSTIPTGTVIAGRFEIGRVAGSGSMGTVYQAHDRVSGGWVALKVLTRMLDRSAELEDRRFIRESQILASLHHPGIASYVDSGQLPDGTRFLAMEWLSGEDLAQRLERGALSISELVRLLEQVGAALAYAHQLGIVHRDIKPSNLFLCKLPQERTVVLDFGVARYDRAEALTALTVAGEAVGTLCYMAPEQALGELHITAAADIYALGRVAYQCLSKRKIRHVAHAAAALAQALFAEDPPLSQICPLVPESLSNLIGRMLAKDPRQRPPDGSALLAELRELGPLPDVEPPSSASISADLLAEEQSLYSVVLAVPRDSQPDRLLLSGPLGAPTEPRRAALDATLVRHRLRPRWLLDGSLLIAMTPSESAHDQAAQAAYSALLIKAQWPAAAVALATGRGQSSRQYFIGEVVDRAAHLLRNRKQVEQDLPQVAALAERSVWVDALSASLLERRFLLLPFSGGALLTGQPLASEDARPVLGALPPCIGREPELMVLDALVSGCTSESVAKALLTIAPPGNGKTRLRQEFLQRLRLRSQPAIVLMGAGELFTSGNPYEVIRGVLRRHFEINGLIDKATAGARLLASCEALFERAAAQRWTPYLGELCGLRFPDEENPELRAARGDPELMGALLIESFLHFLEALCKKSTVVLLLDDLHWGDLPTINLVDRALRELESQPLLVLAFARPEVKEAFPKIRQWPHLTELPLSGLGRTASENLVRFVLGSTVTPETVKLIAQQAAGNALLLEELIRAHGEQRGTRPSETVLAILQARIQRLLPTARLVLGKASVFGQSFFRGGLHFMQDPTVPADDDLDAELRALTQAEFIITHRSSRLVGDVEFSFRHALMREAAYALLLDEQMRHWHRLAGQYLLQVGESDAMILAEHFSRGEEPQLAFPHFVRAAARALESNDLELVFECLRRAETSLGSGAAEGAVRGELLAVSALAAYRLGKLADCLRQGSEAIAFLPAGGNRWAQLMYALLSGSMMMGRQAQFAALAERFTSTSPLADARASYVETSGVLLTNLCLFGQRSAAREQIERLRATVSDVIESQAGARAWYYFAQNRLAALLLGEPWASWQYAEEAVSAVAKTANPRWMSIMQVDAALAERELGSPHFESKLRAALELLYTIRKEIAPGYAAVGAAVALSSRREHAEECALLARSVLDRNQGNAYFAGMAHLTLAQISATAGDARAAELEAQAALSAFQTMPPMQGIVTAVLCRALLAQGRPSDARAAAEAGLAQLTAQHGAGFHDLGLRLAAIEVFDAASDRERGDEQLKVATEVLQTRALGIPDLEWRRRYLECVPEHSRLLALARERLGA